jgi:hypothetical protein
MRHLALSRNSPFSGLLSELQSRWQQILRVRTRMSVIKKQRVSPKVEDTSTTMLTSSDAKQPTAMVDGLLRSLPLALFHAVFEFLELRQVAQLRRVHSVISRQIDVGIPYKRLDVGGMLVFRRNVKLSKRSKRTHASYEDCTGRMHRRCAWCWTTSLFCTISVLGTTTTRLRQTFSMLWRQ